MGMLTQMQLFWLVLFLIFLVAELISVGLTSIWFAAGSLAALFASMAGTGWGVQILLAIVVSALLLFLVRPWATKHFNHERELTNAQSLIGEKAIVLEDIDNIHAKGRVLVRGQEWMARSEDDGAQIARDACVMIKDIRGVKLIVQLLDEA